MSDIVTNRILIYRKLEKIYKDVVYDNLEKPCEKIKEIMYDLLNQKAIEYSLEKRNSVYNTKYFHLKSRVKKYDSFYEKLIRKEIGIKLITSLDIKDLSEPELSEKKKNIVAEINLLDDIIGLRIVTELKKDCDNVYKLILNSSEIFIDKGIKFTDLDDQPQKMQNGLGIYRIKGVYEDMYGFELQIKSKIDEAWGDLDHTLFYKDYSVSPIKDTVQSTMNNVGGLLDRIEKLLFDLRDSGGNYSERAEHLQNLMFLEDELGPILQTKLGIPYSLKEIANYLDFFKKRLKIEKNRLFDINFDYLNLDISNTLNKAYTVIRERSTKLLILESVYVNWRDLIDNHEQATQENIDNILSEYLKLLYEFITLKLGDTAPENLKAHLNSLILNECSDHIFLKIESHSITKLIYDRIDALDIDIPDFDDLKQEIKTLICVQFFEGNSDSILEDMSNRETNIGNILYEIKTVVSDSELDTDKLIVKLTTILLEKLTTLIP